MNEVHFTVLNVNGFVALGLARRGVSVVVHLDIRHDKISLSVIYGGESSVRIVVGLLSS